MTRTCLFGRGGRKKRRRRSTGSSVDVGVPTVLQLLFGLTVPFAICRQLLVLFLQFVLPRLEAIALDVHLFSCFIETRLFDHRIQARVFFGYGHCLFVLLAGVCPNPTRMLGGVLWACYWKTHCETHWGWWKLETEQRKYIVDRKALTN